jgi:putative transport protein
LRDGTDVEPRAVVKLAEGDEVLLAGPSGAIVAASHAIGPEIEGEHVMRSVPGKVAEVFVTARDLHGCTLAEIVDGLGKPPMACSCAH